MTDQENESIIRVFVALSLHDDVMAVLKTRSLALQEQYSALNIRWVPPGNYHLTVIFIGNVTVGELDKMESLVRGAVKGISPFDLELGEMALFPPDQQRKGVLIASIMPNEVLERLQSRIESLFRGVDYALIDRPYHPHVTIARIRKNRLDEQALLQGGPSLISTVDRVHIYETHKEDGKVVNSIVRTVEI
jgi:2'-5' RNA ligase